MTISPTMVVKLAQECVKHSVKFEDAEEALLAIDAEVNNIAKDTNLGYFISLIQYLHKCEKLENWLIKLADKYDFAKRKIEMSKMKTRRQEITDEVAEKYSKKLGTDIEPIDMKDFDIGSG